MKDVHNMKQKDIAELLNVTPAAISQYLKQKRGNFIFTDSFKLEISKSVDLIISKKTSVFDQTNKLIQVFQSSKEICIVCSDKNNLKNCSACYD